MHGLRVRSELPLVAPVLAARPFDVEVRWGAPEQIFDEAPDGRVIAARRHTPTSGYALVETPGGYVARFYGICDFRMNRDRTHLVVHADPRASAQLAGVLLAGNIAAVLLGLAGHASLHASAVVLDGMAIAFVGDTGMGKSTLAALFCAEGATLLADDVLRVETVGESCRCFHGTTELRLRPAAEEIAARFPPSRRSTTADGRIALRPGGDPAEETSWLTAIVFPRPSRACRALRMTRLDARAAHFRLAAFPRVNGWLSSEPKRRQFEAVARIAERVRAFEAEIPWGPPFPRDLAIAMRDGLARQFA